MAHKTPLKKGGLHRINKDMVTRHSRFSPLAQRQGNLTPIDSSAMMVRTVGSGTLVYGPNKVEIPYKVTLKDTTKAEKSSCIIEDNIVKLTVPVSRRGVIQTIKPIEIGSAAGEKLFIDCKVMPSGSSAVRGVTVNLYSEGNSHGCKTK